MSIRDEKDLVREINTLKAQKSSLGGYVAFQAEVDKLKTSRQELSEKLRNAQATARELRDYVRKLEILERVRQANPGQTISTSDLRIAEIKVGAAHIPRLIGRKGATLREIEAAAGVTIDVDADDNDKVKEAAAAAAKEGKAAAGGKKGGDKDAALTGEVSVKIMGLESGIINAVGIIEAIAAQVENDIHVSSGLISFLISRSAAAIKALETEFGVKLHAEKDAKTVSARGSPAAVESVRQRLAQLEATKAVVVIPGRALPSVLGKGGANFKRLREEGGAEIEIVRKELTPAQMAAAAVAAAAAGKDAKQFEREKEREEPVELFIYGAADAVARTQHELRSLIEEVKEVEEALEVPRDAIPWLVGLGGERIAAFQKDTGVYARVIKAEDIPALAATSPAVADAVRRHGVMKAGSKTPVLPAHIALVTIRGTKEAMAKAKPAFQALMIEYARCNVILTVSLAQARAIVGPQGATIKQLRTDTGASIEVVEHGREEREERDAKKKEKEKEAAAASAAATATPEAAKKGAAAGAKKDEGKKDAKDSKDSKDAGPRRNRAEELNVPVGHAAVTIRGEAAKVAAASDAVSAAIREYSENRVPVSSSVISALIVNKGELISSLQRETGAVVDIIREAAAAAAASAAAAGGKALTGSLTLQQLGQIPPGGGLIVISGTASAVSAAEARLREIIAGHQERIVALPDPGLVGEIVGKAGANIKALQEELKVEIDVDKAALSLRLTGAPDALDAATVKLQALFEKFAREHATMFVDRNLIPQVIGKGGATIKALQEETGAQIKTETNSGELRISGPEEAIAKAKAKLAEMLKLDQASDTLTLDTAALSRLIGKGGANLRRLQEAHSVAISVDPATGVFTLRGDSEGIAAAKLALKRQSREALRIEEDVAVPQDRVALLIGAKGSKLRSIEADTGCSVELPRDRTAKTVNVRLRGTPLALSKAKMIVSAIASGRAVRALVRPGEHVAELRQGDAARSLASVQAETSTRVMLFDAEPPVEDEEGGAAAGVDAADLPQGLIIVEASQWSVENPMRRAAAPSPNAGGDEAGVARAAMAVDKLIGLRFGGGYAVIALPQALVSALGSAAKASSSEEGEEGEGKKAGKKAAAVSEESAETLAHIVRSSGLTGASLDREGSYVAIWGTPSAVASAKASLSSLASSFAARHTEMTVDGWMVPALVGKKGSGVASLESETGCKIRVEKDSDEQQAGGAQASRPQIDTSKGTIRVAAPSAEALTAAKEKLATLLADMAKRRIVLVIPAGAFGSLIGKGGATIKGLQEATGANFDLDKDRDLVAIRGPSAESVQHAREEITALVEDAGYDVREATDADLAAPLPRVLSGYDKSTLLALVGKAGAGVKRLQEISGARISVDADKGTVTIAGSSDRAVYDGVAAVEAAIEAAAEKAAANAAAAASAAQAAEAAAASSAAAAASQAASQQAAAAGGMRLPVGAAPLTAEERLALASKKGGRNARRREKKRLEKEGLLGPGAPEDSDDEEEDQAHFLFSSASAAAAAAPVAAGAGAGGAASAPVVKMAVAAAPAAVAAATKAPVALPIGGGAAVAKPAASNIVRGPVVAAPVITTAPVALPLSGGAGAAAGGASANDILAKLLPGMTLAFQPMALPTAAAAAPAAAKPAVAAVHAPAAAIKVLPLAAAAVPAAAAMKPVFSAPAPAPAPAAAAPVTIGGVTMQLPTTVTALNISGAGAAPSASASAALAAAGITGFNLPAFNLQAFNPKAAAPAAPVALPIAGAAAPQASANAAAAANKRAPPGLASAPAPVAAAAAAPKQQPPQVSAAAAAPKLTTQSAGFDLSSIGAALGLSSSVAPMAAAPAPVAAAAPARTITTLPLGGAGGASASAAAALAGFPGVGGAPVTSLAALLSSPNAKPAGARTGAAPAASAGSGSTWKGAGGVNVRL